MRSFILSMLFLSVVALAAPRQLAVITPGKPAIGKGLTVTYNATHPKAKLLGSKSVTLQVLVQREGETPLLLEIAMKAKGTAWTAAVPPLSEKAQLLFFRFVSEDKTDDNGGNVWTAMVHEKNLPVKGARQQLAMALRAGGAMGFEKKKDMDAAKAALRDEIAAYPDNMPARTALWGIRLRENPDDNTRDAVKAELSAVYAAHADDEVFVAALLPMFEQTGQKSRADEIRAAASAKNPRGKIAELQARAAINRERDAAKRVPLIEAFLRDFPLQEAQRLALQNSLINALIQAKQYERARTAIEENPKKDGMLLNSLAWAMVEDSTRPELINARVRDAADIARAGVDFMRHPDPSTKPSYTSVKEWQENSRYQLAMILHTYAVALQKSDRASEALPALQEAFTLSKGQNEEVTLAYLDALLAAGLPQQALYEAGEALRAGRGSDEVTARFRSAYVETNGTSAGVDIAIKEARAFARNELKKKLAAGRLALPAPDFTLKGIDGSSVTLSSLKGKVVVLDFWATWCGPCKASFPFLQKVYEQYRNDDRIRIYALDTWENEKGDKREELVRKFISDNKYTFPVLYDEGMVDKYGVTGIPTKFVIDPSGRIAFKSVGFEGGDAMMTELALQFEMLLASEQ